MVGVWWGVRVGVEKTPTLQLLFIHRCSERYGWVLGCFGTSQNFFALIIIKAHTYARYALRMTRKVLTSAKSEVECRNSVLLLLSSRFEKVKHRVDST